MSDAGARAKLIQAAIAGAGSPSRAVLLSAALLAAVLVPLGSLAPWAEIGPVTLNGLDADDGLITLVLGIIAAAVIALRFRGSRRISLVTVSILFDIIAVAGIIDWADISRLGGEASLGIDVSVGWGLMLVTVAGIAGAVLTLVVWSLDRRERHSLKQPTNPT